MRLTLKDGLATIYVAAALACFAVWLADGAVAGVSGRALVGVIFVLGMAGCVTARSQMEAIYGVNGKIRPPMTYVVLVSAVGALALVAGIVAIVGGGTLAVTILVLAMIAMWILATVRHQASNPTERLTAAHR